MLAQPTTRSAESYKIYFGYLSVLPYHLVPLGKPSSTCPFSSVAIPMLLEVSPAVLAGAARSLNDSRFRFSRHIQHDHVTGFGKVGRPLKARLLFALLLILIAFPAHAQTFSGRSGGDIFVLPPFRFCIGEDNGKNVCLKQTSPNTATITGNIVDANGNTLLGGINGVKTTNTFANSSTGDFFCILSLSPITAGPCTPGTPPNLQIGTSYRIVGGVNGGIGDRGKVVKRTNTAAATDTLPAVGSGVSATSTGFGSSFYFTYACWGTATCVLTSDSPSKISVNGAALGGSLTLAKQQYAIIVTDGDGVNWDALVPASPNVSASRRFTSKR